MAGRLMARSFFSLLDAFAFLLTQTLESARYGRLELTENELRFLREGESVTQGDTSIWKPYHAGIRYTSGGH